MKLRIKLKSKQQLFQYRTDRCLNCGHALDISDQFCSYCGQKNSSKTLDLKQLMTEFFSGLIAYDSRLRKTIRALVSSPGKLSLEYIQGKRISYVNPFRFFISTAIVFFLIVSWINRNEFDKIKILSTEQNEESKKILNNELNLDSNSESIDKNFDLGENSVISKIDTYIKTSPEPTYIEALEILGLEESLINMLRFDFILGYNRIVENPAGFINFLLPKFPFFLFFFIPLFSLFNTIFYIRKKIPYTHHLIFNYNQQTVFLILLFLAVILDFVSFWIWLLIYAFYLYKSMRSFYGQGRFKTIGKQILIMNFYWISALLVLTSLATLSIIFF